MSPRHDIDDAQAAVIDQRIGQSFAFLRDVLADPALIERIPTGATLRHRDVVLPADHAVVRLTAYQTPAMATWSALVTGSTDARRAEAVIATSESAEAALDALEAELRRAIPVEAG